MCGSVRAWFSRLEEGERGEGGEGGERARVAWQVELEVAVARPG